MALVDVIYELDWLMPMCGWHCSIANRLFPRRCICQGSTGQRRLGADLDRWPWEFGCEIDACGLVSMDLSASRSEHSGIAVENG